MTEFVRCDESNDILTILISSEMVNPEEPPEDPQKKRRGRPPKIFDPNHYTTYRKEYYKKNAKHWNEYQKQWIKEKRRQNKIQRCIQFISDQVGKK
jgi:hypothetical protein